MSYVVISAVTADISLPKTFISKKYVIELINECINMKRYYDSSISFHIAFMTEILFFNFAAAVTARIIFNDFKTFFEHKREQEHLKFSNSNSISKIKILIVRTIFPLRKIFQSINRRVLSILKKLHEFLSLSLTKCETPDSMRYK